MFEKVLLFLILTLKIHINSANPFPFYDYYYEEEIDPRPPGSCDLPATLDYDGKFVNYN